MEDNKELSFDRFFEIYKQKILPQFKIIEQTRIKDYKDYKNKKISNLKLIIINLLFFIAFTYLSIRYNDKVSAYTYLMIISFLTLLSFFDDNFMIAISTKKDLFEIGDLSTPCDNPKFILQFWRELSSIYKMVEYFKLNEKMYSN